MREFSTCGDVVVEKKGHVMAPIKAGNLTVKVTCIAGSGLKAVDANGLADAYLVVAVRDKSGKTRGDIEAQSTKFVPKNLNPSWGDAFTFDGLAADDQFFVQCFDKDLTGSDDSMGDVVITIASLGLKKGTSGKPTDYTLSNNAGKVQLMFGM